MVKEAHRDDCLTLSRLCLDDDLPKNSESRVIGVCLRLLKRYSRAKFIVSYADPAQGHVGGIYQATGWLYTGISEATPVYDLGDGIKRHSRSVSHEMGTHSAAFLKAHGIEVKTVPQFPKHRYLYLLDSAVEERLTVPVLPYPKAGVTE